MLGMSVLAEAQRSSRGTSLRLGKAILGQLGVPRRQNASGHEFRRFRRLEEGQGLKTK